LADYILPVEVQCMIKVSLSRLEKEPVVLEGEEPESFWGLPENDPYAPEGKVSYSLTASSVPGSILVAGRISGKISGVCGRCLKPVSLLVENRSVSLYFSSAELKEEELDLTEELREELLQELPMNLLCAPDCKGLCPQCGKDLNHGKCKCKVQGSDCWGALDSLDLEK